jgi:hypothetical protein
MALPRHDDSRLVRMRHQRIRGAPVVRGGAVRCYVTAVASGRNGDAAMAKARSPVPDLMFSVSDDWIPGWCGSAQGLLCQRPQREIVWLMI